jgi:hypothetical protein
VFPPHANKITSFSKLHLKGIGLYFIYMLYTVRDSAPMKTALTAAQQALQVEMPHVSVPCV